MNRACYFYNMNSETLLAYDLQFFAKDGPGGEKTEQATPKKLDDARKEGQVVKSKDVSIALSLLVMFTFINLLSPVKEDSSTALFPPVTIPSTGI